MGLIERKGLVVVVVLVVFNDGVGRPDCIFDTPGVVYIPRLIKFICDKLLFKSSSVTLRWVGYCVAMILRMVSSSKRNIQA